MGNKLKPTEEFTGLTAEQWLAQSENIVWAQREPRFRMMLSAVLNECRIAHATAAGCTGERAFGRVEGYHLALEVLRSLGRRPEPRETLVETTDRDALEETLRKDEPLD